VKEDILFIPPFEKDMGMVGPAVGSGLAEILTIHPGIIKETN
jgi:hypothetical protein